MEEQSRDNRHDWETQRMDEQPLERIADEEVEIEELIVDEPKRRERLPEDTRLDVEVVRVRRRDDFDEKISADDDEEEEAATEDAAVEPRDAGAEGESRKRFKLMRQIVLGTILNADSVRENYRHVIAIAVMLFVSILMLFSSLDSYLRYTKLKDEVHLLRERAIRMSEQRYEHSSHSAIVRRLRERGIKLEDPSEPHEILD